MHYYDPDFNSMSDSSVDIKPHFYSLWAIVTIILIPPLWPLSVPAFLFSEQAKKLYSDGNTELSFRFADKTKKFLISSWAVFAIILATTLALRGLSHLSLI